MGWVGGQGRAGVEGVQYVCTMSWFWDDNSPITQFFNGGIGLLSLPACLFSVRAGTVFVVLGWDL